MATSRFCLIVIVVGCSVWPASLAMAQPGTEYVGKLQPDLVPDTQFYLSLALERLPTKERAKLPDVLQPSDGAFGGTLPFVAAKRSGNPDSQAGVRLVLVEPESGQRYLYIDLDLDGVLRPSERVEFAPGPRNRRPEATVWLNVSAGPFRRVGVLLTWSLNTVSPANKPEERRLLYSKDTFAQTVVSVSGRQTLLQLGVSDGANIDPRRGFVGVDSDGDGVINTRIGSPESAWAQDESIVFRVGSRYLSIKDVDLNRGTVTLVERPRGDYVRIELTVGARLPDFVFTDFLGHERRVSEFLGKYVLLDFWGTSCAPCVGELPSLKETYKAFKDRGFEIIGMDWELPNDTQAQMSEGLLKAMNLIKKLDVTWTQASTSSIKRLNAERLRISAFPFKVLLDREGKITSVGSQPLSLEGEDLSETLSKLLPAVRR